MAEEDEPENDKSTESNHKRSDVEAEYDKETNFGKIPGTEVGDDWYFVLDGPFSDAPPTNRDKAKSVYQLKVQVSLISILI